MKYCPYCGTEMLDDVQFCTSCGKQFVDASKQVDAAPETTVVAPPKKNNRRKGLIAGLVFLALLIAGAYYFLSGGSIFKKEPPSISTLSESCVRVNCYNVLDENVGGGSGFCIFDDHTIITNYHVVDGAVERIDVDTEDGDSFEIDSILAYSEDRDICFLHIADDDRLTPLETGSTETLQKGDDVVAIGSPRGILNTVSEGKFSGWLSEDEGEVLQISTPISSGSSGGALFNSRHELIGMTYASYVDGQDLNEAIPIESISELWKSRSDKSKTSLAKLIKKQAVEIIPDVITMEELLGNPSKYEGREVDVMGYVSSVYWFPSEYDEMDLAEIVLVQDPKDIEKNFYDVDDMDFDISDASSPYQKDLRNNVQDADGALIFGTAYFYDTDDPSINSAEYVAPGDLIIVTGYFKNGKLEIEVPDGTLSLNNCNFLSDDPNEYNGEPVENLGEYTSFILAVNNYSCKELEYIYGD